MPSIAQRKSEAESSHSEAEAPSEASNYKSVHAAAHLISDGHVSPAQPVGKHAVVSQSLWQTLFDASDRLDASQHRTVAVTFPRRSFPSSSSSSQHSHDDNSRISLYQVSPQEASQNSHDERLDIWLSSVPTQYSAHFAPSRDQDFIVRVQAYSPIALSSVILSTSSEQIVEEANNKDSRFSSQVDGSLARQDELLSLPSGAVKVVQTEPVIQGLITSKTNILLAYDPDLAIAPNDEQSRSHVGPSSTADNHDFDFGIDEQFLAQSVLEDFDQGDDLAALDIDEITINGERAQANGITKGHHSALPSSSNDRTFRVSLIENRQALLEAIDSWRDQQEDAAISKVDEQSAILLSEAGLGFIGAFHGDWAVAELTGHEKPRLVRLFSTDEIENTGDKAHSAFLPPLLLHNLQASERFDPASLPSLRLSPIRTNGNNPTSPRPTSNAKHHSAGTPLSCPLPIPFADSLTIARVPSALSVNRTFQTLFLDALRQYFEGQQRILLEGDIIAVGVDQGKVRWVSKKSDQNQDQQQQQQNQNQNQPQQQNQQNASNGTDAAQPEGEVSKFDFALDQDDTQTTGVVHFAISSLTSELGTPPAPGSDTDVNESDFELREFARTGRLGAVVDPSLTKMVQTGIIGTRIVDSSGWLDVTSSGPILPRAVGATPLTSPASPFGRICQLIQATLLPQASMYGLHLSVMVKGARGSGKKTAIRWASQQTGVHLIEVNCFDVLGDTDTHTEGVLRAKFESAASCGPAILALYNVDALAKKSQAVETGQEPAMSNILRDCIEKLRIKVNTTKPFQPVAVFGTSGDPDKCPDGILASFKHEIAIEAPNEAERWEILQAAAKDSHLSPDANLKDVATQTAALVAADLVDLLSRARLASIERIRKAFPSGSAPSETSLSIAGIALTGADFEVALSKARANYSESIGAPKIPNVTWDDVGGLASVKNDILDTIQLPLEHPELFADGLKKRSGILLYGPPGTGKTLLAKAVATSCSLNFFSVKGPELLNMYIGESEANVRRVFQRARDAKPCVIFFDELDSVAPKRGNQGDSGGVMDRIVSQLLAELDGMAGSSEGSDVFVIGATNRPDLLDAALLRPGRFDRMLYLSVSETHEAQLNILQALTRKFKLDPDVGDLSCIANQCPFNLTGADFYALCSDSMLKAMTRKASEVDEKIAAINANPPSPNPHPVPMTPQYYLSEIATQDEIQVKVSRADFESALNELIPSVSEQEMQHYRRVQAQFSGPQGEDKGAEVQDAESGTIGDLANKLMQQSQLDARPNGVQHEPNVGVSSKGKGKARAIEESNGDSSNFGQGAYHIPIEAPQPVDSSSTNGIGIAGPPVKAVEAGGGLTDSDSIGGTVGEGADAGKELNDNTPGPQGAAASSSSSGKGKGKKKDKGKGKA